MLWSVVFLVGLVLGVVAVRFVLSRRRIYKPLFEHRHYEEVAAELARLRGAALSAVTLESDESAAPPPGVLTTAGLALSYSISEDEDRFIHHIAISLPGHVTPHAVGDRFAFYVANRLGIPFDQVGLGASPSTVHHMEFQLDRSEHEERTSQAILTPSERELDAVLQSYQESVVICHPIDAQEA